MPKKRNICDQKQRKEVEDKLLKTKAKRQNKCDTKRKDNEEKSLNTWAKRQRKYYENFFENIDSEERLKRYKKATRFGPIFICSGCERKLFEHQVT